MDNTGGPEMLMDRWDTLYLLVFKGTYDGDELCAIKTLKNIPMAKIQHEAAILQHVAHIPKSAR
jgi:hypothetical protein